MLPAFIGIHTNHYGIIWESKWHPSKSVRNIYGFLINPNGILMKLLRNHCKSLRIPLGILTHPYRIIKDSLQILTKSSGNHYKSLRNPYESVQILMEWFQIITESLRNHYSSLRNLEGFLITHHGILMGSLQIMKEY